MLYLATSRVIVIIDGRSFRGFGKDQCPRCGSKNVRSEAYPKCGGGPHEIDDHVARLECENCGWMGDLR